MTRMVWITLLTFISLPALHADDTLHIRVSVDGHNSEVVIRAKEGKQRIDFIDRQRISFVSNCDSGKDFIANLDLGVYSQTRTKDWPTFSQMLGVHLDFLLTGFPPFSPANSDVSNIGEETQLLGMWATHFQVRPRRAPTKPKHEQGAYRAEIIEDQIDGWFTEYSFQSGCGTAKAPDNGFVRETANSPLGPNAFPLKWVRIVRTKILGADGFERVATNHVEIEVLSISREKINDNVFATPSTFRRVQRTLKNYK